MSGEASVIKGFIETSLVDWPGRVAAVVFLGGCNLRCPFCHNAELVLSPAKITDVEPDRVAKSLESHEGWLDGIVVTGGEPCISPRIERLLEQIRGMCPAQGPGIKLDTNGTRPDVLERLISRGLVDAVAMDVKAPLVPGEYSKAAGIQAGADACVDAIKKSVRILAQSRLEVTFRCTVVPGLHDEDAVRRIAGELYGRPLVLQNFRPGNALDPSYNAITPFTGERFASLEKAAGASKRQCEAAGDRTND